MVDTAFELPAGSGTCSALTWLEQCNGVEVAHTGAALAAGPGEVYGRAALAEQEEESVARPQGRQRP